MNSSQYAKLVGDGVNRRLDNHRIWVLDLYPYFRNNESYDTILKWMPTLTLDEVKLVERYIANHRQEVIEADRAETEYRERQIAEQRKRGGIFADDRPMEERLKSMREKLRHRCEEKAKESLRNQADESNNSEFDTICPLFVDAH